MKVKQGLAEQAAAVAAERPRKSTQGHNFVWYDKRYRRPWMPAGAVIRH